MFKVGIITVPEREESINEIKKELDGFDVHTFSDVEHKGQPFNFTRMLEYFCNSEKTTDYIMLCTDDVGFKSGWFDRAKEVLEKTDYDVVSLFTNRNLTNLDEYGYDGTGKHCLYDQCVIYKSSMLTPEYFKEFMEYANSSERTTKEKNHYDVMHSHFIRDKKYSVLVIQPNLVKHKNIKSTLGHKIKCE